MRKRNRAARKTRRAAPSPACWGGEEKWDAQKTQANQDKEDGMKRTISSSRTSSPCAVPTGNALQLCICEQKCGREAGSDFHEDKSGGRAHRRERVGRLGGGGCLIPGCEEVGRRFFRNNEVKGPSPRVMIGGEGLLSCPALSLGSEEGGGRREVVGEEKVVPPRFPPHAIDR